MNRILRKRSLTPEITLFEIEAPRIAKRWQPGQFIIVRPLADSERIPLTLVDSDSGRGSITIVVQAIGATTRELARLNPEDFVANLVGPLGEPATIGNVGSVLCVAGGVGVAELLPVARAFKKAGNFVTAICGARTSALMILDAELCASVDEVLWSTDDGSNGFKGTVVDLMRRWHTANAPDMAHVIGPIPMMKAAAELTRQWSVPTFASLNPVMIDGTGMCGGCRVTVAGKVRFACIEGPEFDAHLVDFDELARRNRAYKEFELRATERHECRLGLSG
jgi:ferredoxin--NADP+ reductase